MEYHRKSSGDQRQLAKLNLAAMGEKTADALKSYWINPDIEIENVSEFLEALPTQTPSPVVFVVRGNFIDPAVEKEISAAGFRIVPLQVYQTIIPVWPEGSKERLVNDPPKAIIFTHLTAVDGFCQILSADEISRITSKSEIFSINQKISIKLASKGIPVTVEADAPHINVLIYEITERIGSLSDDL
jgi:uroporphyrinogen-III synthase